MNTRYLVAKIASAASVTALVVVCMLLLQTALDANQADADVQDPASRSLVIGTTAKNQSLDPAETYSFHSWEILRNAGEGLLTYVPGTTELTPGLATAMPEVSSDGTVYTFTLRSGLSFPEGAPLNAQAVKWSIDRVAALGGGPSWLVTNFVSETQALDEMTVRFILKQKSALFPYLVAGVTYFPVSPGCFPADDFDADSACGGLGPYVLTGWTQDVSLTMEANAGYYGSPPRTPSISVRYFANSSNLRQALEDGRVDIAWETLGPADYEALEADPDFRVVGGGSGHIRYVCFNNSTPPFDDPTVRAAIAASVDRNSIAQQVYSDTMSPLYSMVPQGMWSHVDAFRDQYGGRDLTRARALLEQAGYSEARKLAFDLWYPLEHYGRQEPKLAAELESDLEETGMASVTLRGEYWADYVDNLGAGTMPAFLLGWWGDYPDPDNYTWPFAHSSGSDDLGILYADKRMDALLEAGRSTEPVQGSSRRAMYEEIQRLWAEEVPTVPLLQGRQTAVTKHGIRGVRISPLHTLPFYTIWDARVNAILHPESEGTLTSDDGNTTLRFPEGAFTRTVVVTHTPLSDIQPGGNLNSIRRAFDLTAVYSGTREAAQVAPGRAYTVTLHYADTEIGPTIEDTLGLYWWNERVSAWSEQGISSSVNAADNVVTAQIDHLSRFAVLGETYRLYSPLSLRNN